MHGRRRYLSSFTILSILVAVLTGSVCAQTTSGTITGTVTDQSGAIVPNAKIILTDEATRDTRESTGAESGEFVFAALRPSTYTILVEKAGFQGLILFGIDRDVWDKELTPQEGYAPIQRNPIRKSALIAQA